MQLPSLDEDPPPNRLTVLLRKLKSKVSTEDAEPSTRRRQGQNAISVRGAQENSVGLGLCVVTGDAKVSLVRLQLVLRIPFFCSVRESYSTFVVAVREYDYDCSRREARSGYSRLLHMVQKVCVHRVCVARGVLSFVAGVEWRPVHAVKSGLSHSVCHSAVQASPSGL